MEGVSVDPRPLSYQMSVSKVLLSRSQGQPLSPGTSTPARGHARGAAAPGRL